MTDTTTMCEIEKVARELARVSGWQYGEIDVEYNQDWYRSITRTYRAGHAQKIDLSYDFHKKRIIINGCWPSDIKGNITNPSSYDEKEIEGYKSEITVSADRTPESIWKDIDRKFLLNYLRMYTRMLERAENNNNIYYQIERNACKIAKALGQKINQDSPSKVHYYDKVNSGDFEVYSDSVNMKISCDVETAIKIAELLKEKVLLTWFRRRGIM